MVGASTVCQDNDGWVADNDPSWTCRFFEQSEWCADGGQGIRQPAFQNDSWCLRQIHVNQVRSGTHHGNGLQEPEVLRRKKPAVHVAKRQVHCRSCHLACELEYSTVQDLDLQQRQRPTGT